MTIDQIMTRIDKKVKPTCWIWKTKSNTPFGYGLAIYNGKRRTLHRIMWEVFYGPIPKGKCVLHHCDTPACCNPKHLWLGTHKDNTQDLIRKGRSNPPEGERAGNAKLTNEDVLEIRRLCEEGDFNQPEIAKMFGVGQHAISRIKNRLRWKHI